MEGALAPADDIVSAKASAKGSLKSGLVSPDNKSVTKSCKSQLEEMNVEAVAEPSVCDILSEDEESSPNCREELRLCGIEIREILLDGREIPDELYVRLFVNKLRVTYQYKTPQQKMDEVKNEAQEICDMNLRISEIDKELLGELKDKQRQKKVEERARLMNRHATL